LCLQLGLPSAYFEVLCIYRTMERHLWIDNRPTGVILKGLDLTGLPQGCPLATFFANLLSALWEMHVQGMAEVELLSYLDDRIILTHDVRRLTAALKATEEFDAHFGVRLNYNKSFFSSTRNKLSPPPSLSARFKSVSQITYLGVDVILAGTGSRPRAKERLEQLGVRCNLITKLAGPIRGKLVADAVSSLWMDGGTWYTKTELSHATSRTAMALRGHNEGYAGNRCRDVEHMLAHRPHRTHPLMAAMVSSIRLVSQLTAIEQWDSIDWHTLWHHRHRARSGPLAQTWQHFKNTYVTWDSPLEVAYRSPGVSLTCKVELHLGDAQKAKHWHDVRELLRTALWNNIALARPKDFLGLASGISYREPIQDLFHTVGAPSVLCGGMWTMMNAYLAGLSDDDTCPRCFSAPETTEHRLWECPCGKHERDELMKALPGLDFTTLPNCLRRCGLPPVNELDTLEYSPLPITHYLINQNLCANSAFQEAKRLQQLTSQGGASAGHRCAGSFGILGNFTTTTTTTTTTAAAHHPAGSFH